MNLAEQIEDHFGLSDFTYEALNTPTNDVIAVTTPKGRFALKLYHRHRTFDEVRWELDLIRHLIQKGAPVAKPLPGKHGYVERFRVEGLDRAAALFEWAPGVKPVPDRHTYTLLGKAAAHIHQAADTFTSSLPREIYDADTLIDDQLRRMKLHLQEAQRWNDAVALGERLKKIIADPKLDRGVCHMDLTPDNVTLDNRARQCETITVFDFDSAGVCWRAIEAQAILRASKEYYEGWLEGYRSLRPFHPHDEKAVAAFCIIGNLRGVAWQLGVAISSRGKPLLTTADLPGIVDGWLDWEAKHLGG